MNIQQKKFTSPVEYESKEKIKQEQEKRLFSQLAYLNKNSKYYSRIFKENNIVPEHIRSMDDIAKLPVTTKDDLQKFNKDFICVPGNRIIDYVTTSGTLGEPVVFALTDSDLERLAYNEALSLSCAECSSEDTIQLMTTIDRRFMAGMAYFLGVRKIGAGIIRAGNGVPEFQWDTIKRFNPTVLIAVPSFLVKLLDYADEAGIDYNSTSIRRAVCIGDSLKKEDMSLNALGKRIKEKWDIELYSTYASTEMSAAFTECVHRIGGHHHPELIITEFLDESNNPVPEGQPGEVTVTTLGVEGMPLLRFKTGDICHHYTDPCPCGRTTMRLGPIIGRRQQMIKFHGTTLYPSVLFEILDNFDDIKNYYIVVMRNSYGVDELMVHYSAKQNSEEFEAKLRDHFRASLRVTPKLLAEKEIDINRVVSPDGSRKEIRLFDNRTI